MRPIILLLILSPLLAPSLRAEGEADKATSGEKFLEQGGKGSVGDGVVVAGDRGGDRSALDLVNASSDKKRIDGKDVPSPGEEGGKLNKAINGGKYAVVGAVVGGVVLGVAGAVAGPAGVLGGAAAGVKLGAVVGAGVGFAVGWLMGSGKKSELETNMQSRQSQLDELMK